MKYIGIDGCQGGWFYVWLDDGHSYGFGILDTIAALAGLLERQQILSRSIPSARIITTMAKKRFLRRQARVDDILDALCGAVTAAFRDDFIFLPNIPETDPHGLPMQIVYADPDICRPSPA